MTDSSSLQRVCRSTLRLALAAGIATLIAPTVRAEDAVSIPRKEWEQMKREMAEMRRELNGLKSNQTARTAPAEERGRGGPATSALAALTQRVDQLADSVDLGRSGENKVVIAGNASATWAIDNHGSRNSGFSADFSPILLWHLNDKLMFEGELEFELEDHDTLVNLEYAQLDWSLDDHLTLVAGKFLSPMNIFVERYEPKWINRLPDTPLAIYDGILPETNLGFQLRGAYSLWNPGSKLNFSAFVSNAPSISTSPDDFGQLDFDNFNSGKHNVAVGGRVGLQLCPNFEVGYGFEYARAQPDDGGSTSRVWLQSVDLQAWIDALKGRWTLLGQYAWSDVGRGRFDETLDDGTERSLRFSNRRNGGYVQLSYRGRQWDSDLLNRLEFVVRADRSEEPTFHDHLTFADSSGSDTITFGGGNERRLSFGIDYWLTSYTVLKAAYELDHTDHDGTANRFLIGVATGL